MKILASEQISSSRHFKETYIKQNKKNRVLYFMKLLASEQISSNRKFRETYQRQNRKKKKEVQVSFHQLLENEQNRLEEQNK